MSEFVHSGRRLIANRKFQEAVKVCRLGLLKDPACLEGRLVLAQALMSLARYDEVLAEARAALELDPGAPKGTILLGEALFFKGAYAQARDALRQAALLSPQDEKVQRLLSELEATAEAGLDLDFTGELGDSTRSYPREEELDPNFAAVGDSTEIQQAPPLMEGNEERQERSVSPERHFAPASDDFGSTPDLKTSAHPEEPDAAYAERPLPVAGEVQVTQRAEPHPDNTGTSVDVSHPDLQVSIQANDSGASTPGPGPEESDQAPGQDQHFNLEPEPTASGVPDPREGSKPGQRWSDRRWLRTEDALTREALIVPSPGLDTAKVRKSNIFFRHPRRFRQPRPSIS